LGDFGAIFISRWIRILFPQGDCLDFPGQYHTSFVAGAGADLKRLIAVV